MMKLTTKFLVAGAVAAVAIAMSAAPSDAARKRAAAAPKSCIGGPAWCSSNCGSGWCSVSFCGVDGNWYPALLTPVCPQGACVNVRKKC